MRRCSCEARPAERTPGASKRARRARGLAAPSLALWIAAACLLLPLPAVAISGIEGTFEYALDAPWRLEPRALPGDGVAYGQIPLQITILDAQFADADDEGRTEYDPRAAKGEQITEVLPAGALRLGRFCSLKVEREVGGVVGTRTYDFADLSEIERDRGRWRETSAPSRREVCRQDLGETCAHMAEMARSSAWHGLAWYPVPNDLGPGDAIELSLEVKLARETQGPCSSTDPADVVTLSNFVSVELGRAPLPRFSPAWVYGDLHYHSQGTDNEGEGGHNYRGVVRAMGALGLDFAFATEHASASQQIVDADLEDYPVVITSELNKDALRDMNDARFRALLADLHAEDGVNSDAALRAYSGVYPQTALVNGTAPQLFLGGEVDVIPETGAFFPDGMPAGNRGRFDVTSLCGGRLFGILNKGGCDNDDLYEQATNGYLIRDNQGVNSLDYGRLHLVYLPRSASDEEAFVASFTGELGGASRRLAEFHQGQGPVGPHIREHGYAFVAHPMSGLGGGGGGKGPDGMPWGDHMLEKAFREPAILGLQLWNENSRREHRLESQELSGYERPDEAVGLVSLELVDDIREGFYTGLFELDSRAFLQGSAGEYVGHHLFDKIAHGTYAWDEMNLWGLLPGYTSTLDWLEPGEPRRVFMAGGSDAHGDFNFRREGYMTGDKKITDTAIGKPRNLIDVGLIVSAPVLDQVAMEEPASGSTSTTSWVAYAGGDVQATAVTEATVGGGFDGSDPGGVFLGEPVDTPPPPRRLSQSDVVDALAEGRFSITDGPALRIAIDRDGDGAIDGGDAGMGEVVDLYGNETLPLLIDWRSTSDFGEVTRIDVIVGAASDSESRLYGPSMHGARGLDIPSPYEVIDEHETGGRSYFQGADHYWKITDTPLSFYPDPGPPQDPLLRELDPGLFLASPSTAGSRFFVRVVARTSDDRFAYSNPIWAIKRNVTSCPCEEPRAIDGDGDGLPDGCDPRPASADQQCLDYEGVAIEGTPERDVPTFTDPLDGEPLGDPFGDLWSREADESREGG